MKKFELVDKIVRYEHSKISNREVTELFAYLIKKKVYFKLGEYYLRMSNYLIENKYISKTGKILKYFGG